MKTILLSVLLVSFVGSLEAGSEKKQLKEEKKALKVSQPVTFTVTATVMTEKTGGSYLANGKTNDANTVIFAALPSRRALNRIIEVYCPETGKTVKNVPVRDVGPFNTQNAYWEKNERPLAEQGISNKYGKAKNKAGIDLSLKLCHELGLVYPYKGTIVWSFSKPIELAKN